MCCGGVCVCRATTLQDDIMNPYSNLPKTTLTALAGLTLAPNDVVHIVGKVVDVAAPTSWHSKEGKQGELQELTLIDEQDTEVVVTFFDDKRVSLNAGSALKGKLVVVTHVQQRTRLGVAKYLATEITRILSSPALEEEFPKIAAVKPYVDDSGDDLDADVAPESQ